MFVSITEVGIQGVGRVQNRFAIGNVDEILVCLAQASRFETRPSLTHGQVLCRLSAVALYIFLDYGGNRCLAISRLKREWTVNAQY